VRFRVKDSSNLVPDGQPTRDRLSRTRRVDNFALAKKDYFKQKVPVRAFLLSHLPLCGIKKIHDRLKKLSLTVYPTGVYLRYEARHNRLRRIEGQVRGLQQMVESEKYCVDIITQSNAIKKALGSVENVMLEHHLSTHVVHQMRGKEEDKAINEILKVYKLAQNK